MGAPWQHPDADGTFTRALSLAAVTHASAAECALRQAPDQPIRGAVPSMGSVPFLEVSMVPLAELWLPILLSAVIVFLVSSAIHMVSPWHKNDYPGVPDEARLRAVLAPLAIPPGDYMVPRAAGSAEMRAPEFMERVRQGPNLILTVIPNGPWNMGRTLGLWFAY